MRANIKKVIEAFTAGEPASGDSKRTCSTNGYTIFSYEMPIAWRLLDGSVVVAEYDAGPSRTTKSQIRACEIAFPGAKRGNYSHESEIFTQAV